MKKTIPLLLIALCGLSGALRADSNLLTNGSFEDGLKDWRVDKPGKPVAEAVVVDEAAEGKQALKLQFTGKRRSNVYLTVWRSVKLQPLTRYRFSFRAKTPDSGSFWAGVEYKPMVTVKGNQPDWKEYSFEFSSGEKNSAHLRFLVDSQAGSILIDDVRLEKAPSAPTAEMTASLLAFGARPDGSEDAAPAFRKAVEAGAKTILIPAGTFAVGELALPDSVSLRGVGEESRLIPFGEKPKFVVRGGSNAIFSDFSVDLGGKKEQALFFLRARNVTVSRVFIRNSTAFGINFDHVDGALIENCVIRDTHTGIMQTYCSNVRTMRNTVTGSIKHGIQFWSQDHWRPEARTRNLWFCDNYVKNSPTGDGGIWGVGVIGVVMSGNIVECARDVGLDLEWCEDAVISGNVTRDTEHGGISLFFSCRNVTITGNTVVNNRVYDKEPGGYWVRAGIWLTYPNTGTFKNDTGHENITIAGNTIVNGPGPRRPIWVGSGRNILIRNNNIDRGMIYHGGKHGAADAPINAYDSRKDYRIDASGAITPF